jgi:hypothetical protein
MAAKPSKDQNEKVSARAKDTTSLHRLMGALASLYRATQDLIEIQCGKKQASTMALLTSELTAGTPGMPISSSVSPSNFFSSSASSSSSSSSSFSAPQIAVSSRTDKVEEHAMMIFESLKGFRGQSEGTQKSDIILGVLGLRATEESAVVPGDDNIVIIGLGGPMECRVPES